jgi:hypothetical protein
MTTDEREILKDNQHARSHADKYLAAVDLEMFARGQMLTAAMDMFSKFLDLPETSSKLKAFFETALNALALVQPELFLVKFLGEEAKAVDLALTIAEATGSKAAKAVRIAGKVSQAAEKVKGVKEKYDGYQDRQEKKKQAPEAAEKLGQLDASLEPIIRLVDSYARAQDIWSKAIDTLDKEFDNRLDGAGGPPKETMEAMARRLLRLPERLGKDELVQLRTAYLWELVSAWAKSSVTIVDIPPAYGYVGGYEYKGINNTQRDTVMEWFGFGAKRGRIYYKPAFLFLSMTLGLLGAKTEKRKVVPLPRAG